MTRPRSHAIDTEGQRIFTSLLPSDWVAREDKPDYGIDYVVEVFANEQLTGLRFAVQLKSTTALKTRGRVAKVRLSVKNLADYVDKQRLPVFLVVVDTQSREGYWCFLQGYVDEGETAPDWRAKKSVTIKIPLTHRLSDTARLATATAQADSKMAELRPGAPEAAIRAEEKRQESHDPRFSVRVKFDENGIHYRLSANEPVETQLNIKGEPADVHRKFVDLVERGLPVEFKPGEANLTGSPLFGELAKMHIARHYDVVLYVIGLDRTGKELARIDLPGKFSGGQKELRFTHTRKNIPLDLRLRITSSGGDQPNIEMEAIELAPVRWRGQRLTQLAYFEQINTLCQMGSQGIPWNFECYAEGKKVFDGVLKLSEEFIGHAWGFVGMMAKARRIAAAWGPHVVLPEQFTQAHAQQVDQITKLLDGLKIELPTGPESFEIELSRSDAARFADEYDGDQNHETVVGEHPTLRFSFLDDKLDIGPIKSWTTDLRFSPSVEEFSAAAKTREDYHCVLTLEPNEKSRRHLQLAS